MKTTAFCCVALAAAACGFEGSDGSGEAVSAGPPVEPLPIGNGVVRGVLESPEMQGNFGVALLPNGFALPATSPCVPSNLRQGAQRGAFSIAGVAPGDYMLVAYHFGGDSYTSLERTLRKVTVTGESTDAGTFVLPAPVRARASDGGGPGGGGPGGDDDKVTWSAPAGFSTLAFDVSNATFLCQAGSPLLVQAVQGVQGGYAVPTEGVHDVKIVVESTNKEQMAIQVLKADD